MKQRTEPRNQVILIATTLKIYTRFFAKICNSLHDINKNNKNVAHLYGCAGAAQGDQPDGTVCHKADM